MRLLLILTSLLLISGCDLAGKSIPGSGTIKREAREVGDFEKIVFAGAATLAITAGAEQTSCEVQCDDNLLEHVSTEVVGKELRIYLTNAARISPTKGLQIEISVPSLKDIELAGSTTTSITGLKESAFDASLAGSHELKCDGQAETVQFEAAGSCKILAEGLETKSTSIELAGSGSADVQASDKLDVEIAGSGTVRYRGEPAINKSVAGSGKIVKLP